MNKSKVSHKEHLANDVYKITFSTDDCRFKRPGQFAMIEAGGLVRPFPVCDYDSGRFSVVFRADCEEGAQLLAIEIGTEVGSLTGLGNGFNVDAIPDGAYLVADGPGIAEMLELARCLLTRGKSFKAVHADYVCASGSLPMLRKLVLRCSEGQFSLSNQMLTTSEPEGELIVPTKLGDTSSINDGPVYDKNEIRWNDLSS